MSHNVKIEIECSAVDGSMVEVGIQGASQSGEFNFKNMTLPNKSGSEGVVYLCTGSYSDMLTNSINSLIGKNPQLPFHVLSDRPLSVDFTWIASLTGKASRQIKTNLHKYSPFDITLFCDSDTVFGEKVDLDELLEGSDLAMAFDADPQVGRGARVFLKYQDFTSEAEVEETLSLCGEDYPFYNSGVMIWRKSEKTREFFERWHMEWLKYRRADQLALARALCVSDVNVKTLPQKYNFPVMSDKLQRNKAIYHLIFKEGIAKEVGLWNLGGLDLRNPVLVESLRNGTRAENQYLRIGFDVYNDVGAKMLVVCPKGDECFWDYVSRGSSRFVVSGSNNPIIGGDRFIGCDFNSKVGEWIESVELPQGSESSYDYVVINGPSGFNSDCPGRQIPIAWASVLATKKVYVFDYNREWEQLVCQHYLGLPEMVVDPVGKGNAKMAVFNMKRTR